jgi:hypothetical protein
MSVKAVVLSWVRARMAVRKEGPTEITPVASRTNTKAKLSVQGRA